MTQITIDIPDELAHQLMMKVKTLSWLAVIPSLPFWLLQNENYLSV